MYILLLFFFFLSTPESNSCQSGYGYTSSRAGIGVWKSTLDFDLTIMRIIYGVCTTSRLWWLVVPMHIDTVRWPVIRHLAAQAIRNDACLPCNHTKGILETMHDASLSFLFCLGCAPGSTKALGADAWGWLLLCVSGDISHHGWGRLIALTQPTSWGIDSSPHYALRLRRPVRSQEFIVFCW